MATTDVINDQTLPTPVVGWQSSSVQFYRPVIIVPDGGFYTPVNPDNLRAMNGLYRLTSEANEVSAFVAKAESVPGDYSPTSRGTLYFGSEDIGKRLTPWDLLHDHCSCVEGHLNQVRAFLESFSSWSENHEHEIDEYDNISMMLSYAEDLKPIDMTPLVRTLERLMEASKEARKEAEDLGAPVLDDLETAERWIETAIDQISS